MVRKQRDEYIVSKKAVVKHLNISGFKNTKQRNKIIQILQNAKTPVTAEEIYLQVKKEPTSIVLSTIYRNMETLLKKGIVTKTIYSDGKSRYELTQEHHTHRMICLKCNKSVVLEECPIEFIEKNLEMQDGFEILEHKIEIYGHCADCKTIKN
jgi:Fur family ferric uptake transcriptional regulator